MAKKATFVPKTRINQLYTCYVAYKDRHGDKAIKQQVYKLAGRFNLMGDNIDYILLHHDPKQTTVYPAITIPDHKFAKHFVPTNS